WMVVALWHFTPFSALGYLSTVGVLGLLTGTMFWFVVRLRLAAPAVPLWVAFPVAWTALEWLIGHLGDVQFPWLGLGTSLAVAVGYGVWRERTLPVREVGVIGLIQPNEGFREKWAPAHRDSVVAKLVGMSRRALALARPALVVWPEAAVPDVLWWHPAWADA